jgi:hypothetical protein
MLVGCYKIEYSNPITTEGVIIDKNYLPAHDDTIFYLSQEGTYIPMTDDHPAKYQLNIKFGNTSIWWNCSSEFYEVVSVNQTLSVTYQDKYKVKYKEDEEVSRELVGSVITSVSIK